MNRIWFVIINDAEEGPFNAEELLCHPLVTVDTLAWREGFEEWTPIRNIPELRPFFDEPSPQKEDSAREEGIGEPQEELALDYTPEPGFFYLWILLAILLTVLIYYYYFI